jgi:hypothetical protein
MTATTDQRENVARWIVAVVVAAVAMLLIASGAFILSDWVTGGPSAREASRTSARLLEAQHRADLTSECRSEWAASDRVASANLDVAKAQVIDLFAQAVIIGDTSGLVTDFRETERLLHRAIRQRVRVSQQQGDITALCDPERPGGPQAAPQVQPLDPPESTVPTG